MSDAVPLLSVGATATVAIIVPLITARLERARLSRVGQSARLDELRGVLDSSAIALAESELALADAERAVEVAQSDASTSEDVLRAATALGTAEARLRTVWEHRYRTAVRLSGHAELPGIYERARSALEEELAILQAAANGGPSSDEARSWGEVTAPLAEVRGRYRAEQDAFLRDAANLVGPSRVP